LFYELFRKGQNSRAQKWRVKPAEMTPKAQQWLKNRLSGIMVVLAFSSTLAHSRRKVDAARQVSSPSAGAGGVAEKKRAAKSEIQIGTNARGVRRI